jgi:RHS Repeat
LEDTNWDYKYDDQGRLIEKVGLLTGADANITWKYGYDAENRLTMMAEYTTSTSCEESVFLALRWRPKSAGHKALGA